MNFSISEKDKKTLFVFAIVAVIALAYFAYSKIDEINDSNKQVINELNTKHADLKTKRQNKTYYVDHTKAATDVYTGIVKKYGTGITQEYLIMLLVAAEEKTDLWIKNTTLAQAGQIYTFGEVKSTNPETKDKKVYESDYIGINSVLSIQFQGTYEQVKEFVKFINKGENKFVINNVTMSYSGGDELVSGTMQLTMYAITGSDRTFANVDIHNVAIGTDNIFDSDTFISNMTEAGYGDRIQNDYDLFLMLNSKDSDMDTVTIGEKNDITGDTTISVSSNVVERASIKITGRNGNYRVSYQIGNEKYPSTDFEMGKALLCGETLDLLVISSQRKGMSDTSGVKLSIVNESDLRLNYKVVNDDEAKPRLNIDSVEGEIKAW